MTKGKADTVSKEEILASYVDPNPNGEKAFLSLENIYKAMEEYAQAYAQTESKWIDVKDGLPEHGQAALCFFHLGGTVLYWYHEKFGWQDVNDDSVEIDISNSLTHWMPLPPPPEQTTLNTDLLK